MSQQVAPTVMAGAIDAYDAHQRELYSFLLRATRDASTAEDLTQETFLRLINEMRAGRTPVNMRAWLYRVAANLVLSRGRRSRSALRWLQAQPWHEVEASPEDGYLQREQAAMVSGGLATLSADARVALLMAAHGFSGAEIARALDRSDAATRTLLCRSRLQLRTALSGQEALR